MDTKELEKQVDYLRRDVEKLKSLQDGGGGGGGTVTDVTATSPIASSGGATPDISIAITPADPGGAIAKQTATPGTQQTSANINIDGKVISGSLNTGAVSSTSVSTGAVTASTVSTTGAIAAGTSLQAQTTIQAVSGPYYLGSIPILDRGSTFPTSSLVDGQRYWNTTYRSWFTYVTADSKWRQESPGVFDGSFPTVSSGDNTVAPKIEIKRRDRNGTVYFWDGARWLTLNIYPIFLSARLGVAASFTLSASTSAVNNGGHPDGSSDVYIETIITNLFPNGTNNGSNYWIAQFRTRNSAGTATNTYSGNTSAGSTSTIIPIVITVGAVVTKSNFFDIVQDVNTSGSPGTVNFYPALVNCRLVG